MSYPLVDPELRSMLDVFPTLQFGDELLPFIREQFRQLSQATPKAPTDGVLVEEAFIMSQHDAQRIRVLVYLPQDYREEPRPGVLHIHGEGYVIGTPELNDAHNRLLCRELGMTIVSVDCRLAPEWAFPVPQEDCYAALTWLCTHAHELYVDPRRIVLYGQSAGGGLAASVAIMARDRGEVSLAAQLLIYPILDDRTCVDTSPNPNTGKYIWTRASNVFGWTALLGQEPGQAGISPYAAPARVESVAGLPPT